MRFAKMQEKDSCTRDAEMVRRLYESWLIIPSDGNKERFDFAADLFSRKHQVEWDKFLSDKDKREEGRGI